MKALTHKDIIKQLMEELGIKNPMSCPRLQKIVVSAGVGKLAQSDKKIVKDVVENLKLITGQNPTIRKARLSISNFKLREGQPVGVSVTLRGEYMYQFLHRLVNIVLPRVRDLKPINPKSFDGNGNISIGLRDHLVFPEINPDDIVISHGMQINLQTSAKNNEEGLALLKQYNLPFKK